MNKFNKALEKLDSSQSKTFDEPITINGSKPINAAIDRYTDTFEGAVYEVIEVEVALSLLPFGTLNGGIVDIGDGPRSIRTMSNDGRHATLILNTLA